jgi:hypothetical protein
VRFITIYTIEANPINQWRDPSLSKHEVKENQTTTIEERRRLANEFSQFLMQDEEENNNNDKSSNSSSSISSINNNNNNNSSNITITTNIESSQKIEKTEKTGGAHLMPIYIDNMENDVALLLSGYDLLWLGIVENGKVVVKPGAVPYEYEVQPIEDYLYQLVTARSI